MEDKVGRWYIAPFPYDRQIGDEVFVFGSNLRGFHGKGAAATAWGVKGDYKTDEAFQKALTSKKPEDKVGRWAILGVAKGYMQGQSGQSYAIATVEKPGGPKIDRKEIYFQLQDLCDFAEKNPQKKFIITPLGEGYAGYTREEMEAVWGKIEERGGIPYNFIFWRLE